jgi:fucose permease
MAHSPYQQDETLLNPSRSTVGKSAGLILLAFLAYISLGLPDGLLGVAWPSVRRDFGLNHDALGALMIAFTVGYLTSSFFGGRLMAHFRLGVLLTASTSAAGIALVVYAAAPGWWVMVIAGVAAGLGGGGIDVTLNTYVAFNNDDRLMQWLHASYGIGATIGPVIMTTAIAFGGSWRWGYSVVASFQFALMVCFLLTIPMWEKQAEQPDPSQESHTNKYDASMRETLRLPAVWLSIFLFFLYMGVEVAFGAWSYTLLTESRGVSAKLAGYWISSYWGIFTVGRIFAGIYTLRVSRLKLITGSLMSALSATFILALDINTPVNLAAITIIGLAIAPVLPALISGTQDRVGPRFSANTIGYQIAAMGMGGAAVPSVTGIVAEQLSLEAIPVFMMILIVILMASYLFSLKKGRRPLPTS